MAAGAALYRIMSDLIFRTTSTDRTVVDAVIAGGRRPRPQPHRRRGPGDRRAHLQAPAARRGDPWPQAHGVRRRRATVGVMLPNANGAAVDVARPDVGRTRAGDDQLHRRPDQLLRRLPGRRGHDDRHLAHLRRQGRSSDNAGRRARPAGDASSISRMCDNHRRSPTRLRGLMRCQDGRWCSATPTIRPRSCSPPARRERPRASCCPTATCSPMPPRRAARIDFGRTDKVFNVLPVFHSFGLTVGLMLPLVSGVPTLSLPFAAALPHRARS